MRIVVAALLMFTLMGAADRASAEINYPWCAEYSGLRGGGTNCGFTSYAQCMASVSGVGGFCRENLFYRAPAADSAPRPRAKKRRRTNQ